MEFRELDRPEYDDIPIYDMGYGEPCTSPIVICRYNESHFISPLHRHNVTQINYVASGNLLHSINNVRYPLVSGDMFVIPPYVPHQILNPQGGPYEIVELEFLPTEVFGISPDKEQTISGSQAIYDFSYIEPFLVSECNVRPRLNLSGKSQVHAERLLDDMLQEFENKEDGYQLAMKADLSKLLVLASRTFRKDMQQPESQLFERHREAMSKTISYINEHFAEPLSIEEVSRIALLSQSYFSYLFKTLTGKTFVEYLHDLRVKNAMELLKSTNDLILDICYQCGFNSINHFNRTFKNAVGLSPRQYRENSRNTLPIE